MKKLDKRGFAHHVALVGFVVVFAVAGVAYLVASNANSCDDAVSGPMSGDPNCQPMSGPTSGPMSGPGPDTPKDISATCQIKGVPAQINTGESINAKITFTNTGPSSFVPVYRAAVQAPDKLTEDVFQASGIDPGESVTDDFPLKYTLSPNASGGKLVAFSVTGLNTHFTCSATAAFGPASPPPPPPPPAPPTAYMFEAENMTAVHPSLAKVLSDTDASGGQYRALNHNNVLYGHFATPRNGVVSVRVKAKSTQCRGAPLLKIRVDGKQRASFYVNASQWSTYSMIYPLSANPKHKLSLAFENDLRKGKKCDRNLFIDKVDVRLR